jgi:hypothetical protein
MASQPESFAIVLGELQDRDGTRVPNDRSPELVPRWLLPPKERSTRVSSLPAPSGRERPAPSSTPAWTSSSASGAPFR